MNTIKANPKYWRFLLLAAAAAVILLTLLVGSAWAHYRASYTGEVTLEYSGKNQVYLLSAAKDENGKLLTVEGGDISSDIGWAALQTEQGSIIPNTYSVDFLLANANNSRAKVAHRQTAKLALVATAGIVDPTSLTVMLTSGGITYTAVPTQITEGSSWYKEYGPGWVYRFYNTAQEELSWFLREGDFAYHEINITVIGTSQTAAALTLVTTAEITV